MDSSGAKDTKALQSGTAFATVSKGTNAGVCMSEQEQAVITAYCCRSGSSVSLQLLEGVEGVLVVIVFVFNNKQLFIPSSSHKTTATVGSISKVRDFLSQLPSPELTSGAEIEALLCLLVICSLWLK